MTRTIVYKNFDVPLGDERVAEPQPPPQALRFSHGRGERETSDW